MIIAGSNISLESSRTFLQRYEKKESLRAWLGEPPPDTEATRPRGTAPPGPDVVRLSEAAAGLSPEEVDEALLEDTEPSLDPKVEILKQIIEKMTGTKIVVINPKAVAHASDKAFEHAAEESALKRDGAGYGIEYDFYESFYETETMNFAAKGVIKTADGMTIDFKVGLSMSREYFTETSVSLRAGDAVKKDPLVINFNGAAAELSDARFTFDLDADGIAEQVPGLGGNSGFLALDRNGDGTINDGRELFGPMTGDGFAELAEFDADGNGWIDQRDDVFGRLSVWRGGEAVPRAIADAGVGAIYLGRAAEPFDIRTADNRLLGTVKSTGVYVEEDGTVGTVQQVDLAV